jgi:hypothetical protein
VNSAPTFELVITATARRQLSDVLPSSIALAAYEFIVGPLLQNPHRVGGQLMPPEGSCRDLVTGAVGPD